MHKIDPGVTMINMEAKYGCETLEGYKPTKQKDLTTFVKDYSFNNLKSVLIDGKSGQTLKYKCQSSDCPWTAIFTKERPSEHRLSVESSLRCASTPRHVERCSVGCRSVELTALRCAITFGILIAERR